MGSTPVTSDPLTASAARDTFTLIPLFHAAWLFALGIATTQAIRLRPSWVLIAVALTSLLCALAALRAQRVMWLPIAISWWLAGTWCAEMEPRPRPEPALLALSDGLLRTVEGVVVDAGSMTGEVEEDVDANQPAAPAIPTQRIDLSVSSVEVVTDQEDAQQSSHGGVRLTVRGMPKGSPFRCGELVRAIARLLPPSTFHDPGAFDRAEFLLEQGITATAPVVFDRVERLGFAQRKPLHCWLSQWQHDLSARIMTLPAAMQGWPDALRLNAQDVAMLTAMVTGDRAFLTRRLRVGFERTGSFHMLVVSGFHLAIVAGCLLWIARRLHLPHIPATFVTILGSAGYAIFTGFATPVQRSLWMVTLYMLGRLVFRQRSVLNVIGFAALCLLAASPRSLFDASFQMTLLAVVAIGGVAAPLIETSVHPYLAALRNLSAVAIDSQLPPNLAQFRVTVRMIAAGLQEAFSRRLGWRFFPWSLRSGLRVTELILVAGVVELAMTLPMAIYFHRITVFAMPVNLLILPLLGVLMPAALLMLLALLAVPPLAVVPAALAALLLHLGVGLVRLFGSMELADFRIPAPFLWQSLLFCALLGAAILLARRRPATRLTWLLATVTIVVAALASVLPRQIDHPANSLLMEAIDVGQGDSLLLVAPGGKTLLVDAGGLGGNSVQAAAEFDVGEEVVSPALWSRGIRRLDAVALSHAHSDHMGGMGAILRNFHPRELWVGINPDIDAYRKLLAEAAELHVAVRRLEAPGRFAFGETSVTVLAPFADYRPGPLPTNNDSLVLRVTYGSTSVLLEGDAEAPIEERMLSEPDLESALLKVGHHGSTSSTRPAFLSRVSPRWAVISCGLHNRYGHPRREVLDALTAAGVRTLSTDLTGASCFELDGKQVKAEFRCSPQTIPEMAGFPK